MIQLLARWLIPDRENVTSPAVRRAYGTLCGVVGIALNILLFAGKFFAGQLSGSIAVTADAFNNLSDGGSSVITLLGFRMAAKKPDPGHPFGHGRIEYLSGVAVSLIIIVVGVQLAPREGLSAPVVGNERLVPGAGGVDQPADPECRVRGELGVQQPVDLLIRAGGRGGPVAHHADRHRAVHAQIEALLVELEVVRDGGGRLRVAGALGQGLRERHTRQIVHPVDGAQCQ